MIFSRIIPLAIALLLSFSSIAQIEFDGCHFYKNKSHKKTKPTIHQLELMEKSMLESDTFDILKYDLELDVTDYSNQMLWAHANIEYTALHDGVLDMELELFELSVDSVKKDGSILAFSYNDEVISVILDAPTVSGNTEFLDVYYHGVPHKDPVWGGFYFAGNYIYNLGIGLSTVPPNFGKVWYPCFDNFKERAEYKYTVTSAGGRKAHCQGDFISETVLGGDTVSRVYEFNYQIPTYLSAIAVANYETHAFVHTGVYGDIDVTLKAKSNHLPGMITDFVNLGDCIDALEFWFGPYAWGRVGYATTTVGALEIPTNIAYPDFMPSQNQGSNETLFAHELGHLWWGDLVTVDSYNNMWLKEGNAEYSEYLFFEYEYGHDEFVDILKDNQENIMKTAHLSDDGFHPLSPMPDDHIYGTHTYQKGAAVMHNLRGYLGDDLYRQGMMALRDSLEFSYMSPTMMRDIISEETGFDLTDFFNDQIYKPGYSVFVIDSLETTQVGANFEHIVHLQQKLYECPDFYGHVPLEISVLDENWEQHDFMLNANGQFSSDLFTTTFEPKMVWLNGTQKLNLARLDLNIIETETSGSLSTVDRTDFRIRVDELNEEDSVLIRINHIWSAPDNGYVAEYITNMSNSHYWIIDGIIPAGTQMAGKVNYRGSSPLSHFDEDLVAVTEDSIIMAYRPDSSYPWEEHPYYFKTTGSSTTNANGSITIDSLWVGQYAFANSTLLVGTEEISEISNEFTVFPNPAQDNFTIEGVIDIDGKMELEIFDIQGLKVLSKIYDHSPGIFKQELDILNLSNGSYFVRLSDEENYVWMLKQLELIR